MADIDSNVSLWILPCRAQIAPCLSVFFIARAGPGWISRHSSHKLYWFVSWFCRICSGAAHRACSCLDLDYDSIGSIREIYLPLSGRNADVAIQSVRQSLHQVCPGHPTLRPAQKP